MSRAAWDARLVAPPSLDRQAERWRTFAATTSSALTFFSIVMIFSISTMLLFQLGYSYEFAGGAAIEKMHPGTLVATAAVVALLLSRRRPFRFAGDLLARRLGLTTFLGVWSALLVYLIVAQKSPFTPIIDAFLLPMMLFVLLRSQRESLARPLELFLHGFLAVNSLLGLIEVMSGWRLVPYTVGGVVNYDDWRSTAILGHPLTNASMTGCYLLILMLGGGRGLNGAQRMAAALLAAAGMVAFGGRAATILLFATAAPMVALRAASALAFGRASPRQAAIAALVALAAPIAIVALVEIGAFDQFVGRFIDDQGSAQTRIAMFDLFNDISWRDLLIGPDPDLIATLKQIEGLEFGIESFWVASALAYGLIMACILFIGLFLFCRDLVLATRPAAWWLMFYFFAVASTSVSLSAKSCLLGMVVAMTMAMLSPPAPRQSIR